MASMNAPMLHGQHDQHDSRISDHFGPSRNSFQGSREPLLQHHGRVPGQAGRSIQPQDLLDSTATRQVLRKIDRTIIPLLFITYMLNFMDKVILSSAATFGLPEDNVYQCMLKRPETTTDCVIEP